MKKIGIVGGIGWPSTVEYYAGICRRCEIQQRGSTGSTELAQMPEIAIESLSLQMVVKSLGDDASEESWLQFDRFHRDALLRLEASGAELAVIASNTPHHRYDAIVQGVGIPVLDLFSLTADTASFSGEATVLLLGTALTMNSPRLIESFAKRNIRAYRPAKEADRVRVASLIRALQQERYDGALDELTGIVHSALADCGGRRCFVCLGCTELSLAFRGRCTAPIFEHGGISFLDTTQIHIDAVYRAAVDAAIPASRPAASSLQAG